MEFPLDRQQDLLELLTTERQQHNLEQELDIWSNVQFQFIEDPDQQLSATLQYIDETQLLNQNIPYYTTNNSPSLLSTTNTSISATGRKKREPIESAEEKKKRNSEASARHRLKKKEREGLLQQENDLLAKKNAELEAKVSKLLLEVEFLKKLVLSK